MILKKEYLNQSNSWLFKDAIKFAKNELNVKIRKSGTDSYKILLSSVPEKKILNLKVEIDYNVKEDKVISYNCAACSRKDCSHYFSAIDYCYHHLSVQDLMESDRNQNLEAEIAIFNKFDVLTSEKTIYIENLLSHDTPLRVYFNGYYTSLDKENFEQDRNLFSDEDIALLKFLVKNRSFTNSKQKYFTIPMNKIPELLFILKTFNKGEIKLKETEEVLTFAEESPKFEIRVSKDKNLTLGTNFNTDNYFLGNSLYFCSANTIYSTHLPISKAKARKLLNGEYYLNDIEIVFMHLLVREKIAKLGHKCYIDCPLPEHLPNPPTLHMRLSHPPGKITMEAQLIFDENHTLPLSQALNSYSLSLQKFPDGEKWCYISQNFLAEIKDYYETIGKIPDDYTEFTGYEVELVKDNIYQVENPAWKIEVAKDLQELLTQKVDLLPEFDIKSLQQNLLQVKINFSFDRIKIPLSVLKKMQRDGKRKYQVSKEKKIIISKQTFEQIDLIEKNLNQRLDSAEESFSLPLYKLIQLDAISHERTNIDDGYLKQMISDLLARAMQNIPVSPLERFLRHYQVNGYNWLKTLEFYHLNGILADEMGTGKTLQALSILTMMPEGENSLVICPKTLVHNWISEGEKFGIGDKLVDYQGNKEKRKELLNDKNKIFVASYTIALRDIEIFQKHNFFYLILDEAQSIKNKISSRSVAVKTISAMHKLAISGTPVENSLQDLWSIFDFLLPGYLPAYNNFVKEVESKAKENYLQKIISPFILRRKKIDILQELSPKEEQVIYCGMSDEQHNYYYSMWEQISKSILNDKKITPIHILSGITKLRQIANGLNLLDMEQTEFSGKMEAATNLIKICVENEKKILVFAQFLKSLETVKNFLISEKIDFSYMDGSTVNRQKIINEFNKSEEKKVFLLSLKVGGLGLNLTAADTVILVDPWWNPMVEKQAIDRTHRIGQTKKINVYKLITQGTIEEKILELQTKKRQLFEQTIEGVEESLKKMNIQELKNLFI